jgi:uncharacterized membrane protein
LDRSANFLEIDFFTASENRAPAAYIAGTLRVLIGADLLRLREIPRTGIGAAPIGGAGTFDGIFITGILAVLLAQRYRG